MDVSELIAVSNLCLPSVKNYYFLMIVQTEKVGDFPPSNLHHCDFQEGNMMREWENVSSFTEVMLW